MVNVEATRYHAAALECINTRLSDPAYITSDGVVASIVGFAFRMVRQQHLVSWVWRSSTDVATGTASVE